MNEDQTHVTPTTSVAGTPGDLTAGPPASSGSSPSSSSSSSGAAAARPAPGTIGVSGDLGAPVDLWDTNWPESGYYWTVVPVAAVQPGALETAVSGAGALLGASDLPVASTQGFEIGDAITIGSGPNSESAIITGVGNGSLTLGGKLTHNHGPGELVERSGGNLIYVDMDLPQDACAAGRISRFGKESEPALTSEGDLFVTGLSSTGRLTSALHTTAFYGQPLISWTPALGADAYEVQWSPTAYPFVPQIDPGTTFKGFMNITTSAVLPVGAGTWYYRVRGYDYSLPTGAQQMSWSDPAKLVVAKPTFKIATPPKTKFKIVGKSK